MMLNEDMQENSYNKVNIDDYPAEEFFVFLLYLYSDLLLFNFDFAIELMKVRFFYILINRFLFKLFRQLICLQLRI